MTQFIKYILKLFCVVWISGSIILPVSFSILPQNSSGLINYLIHYHNKPVWFGIGTLHAIVDSLSDEEPVDFDDNGKSDGKRVLLKQRRALAQMPLDPKPLLAKVIADVPNVLLFHRTPLPYTHPEIVRYKDSKIFLTLNTGVSPPAVFFPSLDS